MKVKTKVEDVARSRAKLTSKQRSSRGAASSKSSSSSSSSSSAAASSTVELVDEPIMFYTLEDDGEREQKSLEEGSGDVQVQDQEHRPKQMTTTQRRQERGTTSLRGAARTNKGTAQERSKKASERDSVLGEKEDQHAHAGATTVTRMKNKKSGHEMNQHQKLQEPRGPLAVVHHDVEDDGYSDTRVRRPWRNTKSTSRRRSTSRFKISTSDLANWFGRDNARGKKMKSGRRGRNESGRLDSGGEMNSSSSATTNLSAAEELYYNFVTMICLLTTVLVLGFIYFRRRKKPIQVGERGEDHRFHQNGTRTTARTMHPRRAGTSRNKRTSSSKGCQRSGLVLYDEPYDESYEEETSELNNDMSGLSKRKKQQQMNCSSTTRNPKSMSAKDSFSFVKKGKKWSYDSENSDSVEEVPESTNSHYANV